MFVFTRSMVLLAILSLAASQFVQIKTVRLASGIAATHSHSHQTNESEVSLFLKLVTRAGGKPANQALSYIDRNWKPAFEAMLLECIYFTPDPLIAGKLIRLLERKTGKTYGTDMDKWYRWLWSRPPAFSSHYFEFKARLHELIDPKFHTYFSGRQAQAKIRLDEVRWGGVLQDGIPPLRNPVMISAAEAAYLNDGDVVFGIEVNGDARAYPKRILAWHEMFVDTVGGVPLAGVYCTLCGTVIAYETAQNGTIYELGTSGFLYRSNKLMYDKATQSLWSTLEGEPVIGPLVNQGIALKYYGVVSTTWGEWQRRHPETQVLSLQTGHRRDYSEGAAYRDYFATDELMFSVPHKDRRLKNKDEILAIRIPDRTDENLAISSKFLKKNTIFHSRIGTVEFTVFTDRSGAHRVYETPGMGFSSYDGKSEASGVDGTLWTLDETQIISENGVSLKRIPSFNAFWFGYKAAFPAVRLIK